MTSAEIRLREARGMLIHDISPVLMVEMLTEPVPSLRGPKVAREGAGELCPSFWEYGVVHLGGGGGVPSN